MLLVLQATSRRLSLLFIANLALGDTLLPLVTSLSTPVLVTIHGGRDQAQCSNNKLLREQEYFRLRLSYEVRKECRQRQT